MPPKGFPKLSRRRPQKQVKKFDFKIGGTIKVNGEWKIIDVIDTDELHVLNTKGELEYVANEKVEDFKPAKGPWAKALKDWKGKYKGTKGMSENIYIDPLNAAVAAVLNENKTEKKETLAEGSRPTLKAALELLALAIGRANKGGNNRDLNKAVQAFEDWGNDGNYRQWQRLLSGPPGEFWEDIEEALDIRIYPPGMNPFEDTDVNEETLTESTNKKVISKVKGLMGILDANEMAAFLVGVSEYLEDSGKEIKQSSGDDAMLNAAKHVRQALAAWNKRLGN